MLAAELISEHFRRPKNRDYCVKTTMRSRKIPVTVVIGDSMYCLYERINGFMHFLFATPWPEEIADYVREIAKFEKILREEGVE